MKIFPGREKIIDNKSGHLLEEVMESPPLEILETWLETALSNMD